MSDVQILSGRHREINTYCDGCRRSVGRRRYIVRMQVNVNGAWQSFRLCSPCLRAAARIAEAK